MLRCNSIPLIINIISFYERCGIFKKFTKKKNGFRGYEHRSSIMTKRVPAELI